MLKTDRIMIFSGVGITIFALILAAVLGGNVVSEGGPEPEKPKEQPPISAAMTEISESGNAAENTDTELSILMENPVEVTLTLTWTDDPDRNPLWVNTPDNFGLKASGPNGQNETSPLVANPQGGQGEVVLSFMVDHGEGNWTSGDGAWDITVVCGDCGDQNRRFRPSLIIFTDTSNDWALKIEYSNFEIEGGEE